MRTLLSERMCEGISGAFRAERRSFTKPPVAEQHICHLIIPQNQPNSCSQTLFRIRCPDIEGPKACFGQMNTMLAGYTRVSTLDQNPELQFDGLSPAGCKRIFEDRSSGTRVDRPGLKEALGWMRKGDALIVRRLDRLGRFLPPQVATVRNSSRRGSASALSSKDSKPLLPAARWSSTFAGRWPSSRTTSSGSER